MLLARALELRPIICFLPKVRGECDKTCYGIDRYYPLSCLKGQEHQMQNAHFTSSLLLMQLCAARAQNVGPEMGLSPPPLEEHAPFGRSPSPTPWVLPIAALSTSLEKQQTNRSALARPDSEKVRRSWSQTGALSPIAMGTTPCGTLPAHL